ncbi:MAG TPA: glycosyltransferase [Candidatus Bathyarchaeia archaeon]|nr:glycosyltransferase [Candidatus Bathyarchaeia archaeon]
MIADTNFSLFVSSCLIVINASWIGIFIISTRSYHLIPRIDRFKTRPPLQALPVPVPLQRSAKNAAVPSTRVSNLSNISLPFVSIIVPARDEEKNIERCLSSLLDQDYPSFEIIAIDDNSTDNTLQIMKKIKENNTNCLETNKLKIVSLDDKPGRWTGKAWASHQGYLHAQGEILLFTDADTFFFDGDVILHSISYLQNEKLDVLTGHAKMELPDFWSKITMPLWDLIYYAIIRNRNPGDANNTSSSAAYLVGSFYMLHRKVLEKIGGFQSVQGAIKEDVELGIRIKRAGFKLKVANMDKFYSAAWCRDFSTLWHGVGRTFLPMSKIRMAAILVSLFFLALFPLLIFPYSVFSYEATLVKNYHMTCNNLVCFLTLMSNISCYMMIIIGIAISNIKNYSINAAYSLLTFAALLLITSASLANIVHFLVGQKRVQWRNRTYKYNSEKLIV